MGLIMPALRPVANQASVQCLRSREIVPASTEHDHSMARTPAGETDKRLNCRLVGDALDGRKQERGGTFDLEMSRNDLLLAAGLEISTITSSCGKIPLQCWRAG